MALSVVIILRITATMTTFGFFPVASRRSWNALSWHGPFWNLLWCAFRQTLVELCVTFLPSPTAALSQAPVAERPIVLPPQRRARANARVSRGAFRGV